MIRSKMENDMLDKLMSNWFKYPILNKLWLMRERYLYSKLCKECDQHITKLLAGKWINLLNR